MKLCVGNLHFSYNSHPVLADITFSLEQGQVMGILGVNGAGKSTLLKCLNRILKPHGGSVLVDGQALHRMRPSQVARRMGYVPQRHPETGLTVFEAVLMGRRPHIRWALTGQDYVLTEKIIEQLGIAHLAIRPVCDLSGGELQRVIIARAMAQTPTILLLDEPTSNLDPKNQLDVMGLIRYIVQAQGLSAVVAIHDLNVALRFADCFVLLKEGRIHGVSPKEALTAEMIGDVYDIDVVLKQVGQHTIVVPL